MRLQLWVENSPRKAWKTRSESWNSVENEKGLKGIPDAFLFLILDGSYGELGREEIQFRKTIFSQFSSVSCQFHEGKGHNVLFPAAPSEPTAVATQDGSSGNAHLPFSFSVVYRKLRVGRAKLSSYFFFSFFIFNPNQVTFFVFPLGCL